MNGGPQCWNLENAGPQVESNGFRNASLCVESAFVKKFTHVPQTPAGENRIHVQGAPPPAKIARKKQQAPRDTRARRSILKFGPRRGTNVCEELGFTCQQVTAQPAALSALIRACGNMCVQAEPGSFGCAGAPEKIELSCVFRDRISSGHAGSRHFRVDSHMCATRACQRAFKHTHSTYTTRQTCVHVSCM